MQTIVGIALGNVTTALGNATDNGTQYDFVVGKSARAHAGGTYATVLEGNRRHDNVMSDIGHSMLAIGLRIIVRRWQH